MKLLVLIVWPVTSLKQCSEGQVFAVPMVNDLTGLLLITFLLLTFHLVALCRRFHINNGYRKTWIHKEQWFVRLFVIDYWAMIECDWLPVDQSLVEKRPTRKLSPWDVATQRSANTATLPSARSSYQSSLSTSWVCLVGCPRSLSKINQTNIATAAGSVASFVNKRK